MQAVYGWVKNIIYFMIFLAVVNNLLADSKYEKYIRFFAGMVLILLVVSPLTGKMRLDEQISSIFQSISLYNDASDLKSQLWNMDEKRLDQILGHGSVDGINIIGNVADDIAGLVLVKKTDRESHQMAEYVRTHLLDDLLAEADQSPGQQPFKQSRDSVAGKHHTTVEKDLWKFHIAFSVDGIDGHTRKLGTC